MIEFKYWAIVLWPKTFFWVGFQEIQLSMKSGCAYLAPANVYIVQENVIFSIYVKSSDTSLDKIIAKIYQRKNPSQQFSFDIMEIKWLFSWLSELTFQPVVVL